MAAKSKKEHQQTPAPVLGSVSDQMVSNKTKKVKKTSRGK